MYSYGYSNKCKRFLWLSVAFAIVNKKAVNALSAFKLHTHTHTFTNKGKHK